MIHDHACCTRASAAHVCEASVWFIWSFWCVSFIGLVLFNQTNETNPDLNNLPVYERE